VGDFVFGWVVKGVEILSWFDLDCGIAGCSLLTFFFLNNFIALDGTRLETLERGNLGSLVYGTMPENETNRFTFFGITL